MIALPQFLIASEAGIAIRTMSDIPNAIGAAYGNAGLILTESELAPEFFDLETGLVGELFQKFTNYGVRLILIVPNPGRYGDRVTELAREHRSHNSIRIVSSKEEAEVWANQAMCGAAAAEPLDRDDTVPNEKLYKAMIWIDGSDQPAKRVTVLAHSTEQARRELETEYGKGNVYNLHNQEDAAAPR